MAEIIANDASARRRRRFFFLIVGGAVLATIVGVALLMNIFERKQEALNPFSVSYTHLTLPTIYSV